MKKIIWITADNFIDVDLPIIPELANKYDIKWFVVLSKSNKIDFTPLLEVKLMGLDVLVIINQLKNRIRNPLLFFEYVNLIYKIKNIKADLYYVDMSGLPFFLPLLKLFIDKKKVVVATHNVSTPKGAVHEKIAKLYMQFTLSAFENFHVFSLSQRMILEDIYPNKKILLAPLALKDYGNSKKTPDKLITFLNFGIIREYKRIDVLILAANLAFEKTKKKFRVKIAGCCDNWDKYQSLIKYPFLFDLHIKSIPNNEVADLFATSHYFVLPYQDIAQSGAITVAFNYNLPVLASDLASFREFVDHGKTGYLFNVAEIEALADLFVYIIENHNIIYPELVNNQRKFVQEYYVVNAIAEKYSRFFEKLWK